LACLERCQSQMPRACLFFLIAIFLTRYCVGHSMGMDHILIYQVT
jgi:hypothetical protein